MKSTQTSYIKPIYKKENCQNGVMECQLLSWLRIPKDTKGYQRIPKDTKGYQRIPAEIDPYSSKIINSKRHKELYKILICYKVQISKLKMMIKETKAYYAQVL